MKRELGIARCGLACCLCSENSHCVGCNSDECPGSAWCENRRCSAQKGISGCWQCGEDCHKGMFGKIKPYGFKEFVRRYGAEKLMDCLEHNEQNGIVYHREGISGDYDDFSDVEALIDFILSEKRRI